jgi:hypothetical protein
MGKTRGPYEADFPVGTKVKVIDRDALDALRRNWRWHHAVQPEQLGFAGREATVKGVSFYHGGDEVYELEGLPGLWHEQCLDVPQAKG